MKKRLILLFLAILLPLMTSAQASGGQIKRTPNHSIHKKVQTRQEPPIPVNATNVAITDDGKKFLYETSQSVDLGLPSGTIWGGWNIGAKSPLEIGDYYAWGAIWQHYNSEWHNYFDTDRKERGIVHFKKYKLNACSSIIGTDNDVAYAKWGYPWKMPTKTQIQELLTKCKIYFVRCNGSSYHFVLFKGPNRKCLLFPCTGIKTGPSINDNGALCWSGELDPHYNLSNMAYLLKASQSDQKVDSDLRCYGLNVRAVRY